MPDSPSSTAGSAAAGEAKTKRRKAAMPAAPAPSAPPPRTRRAASWLFLLLCLVVAMPPLVLELDQFDAVDPAEARSLATSIETWHRWQDAGDSANLLDERLFPSLGGRLQLHQPPASTWQHMIGFSLLSELPSIDRLILQARMTSVLMALITLACVFWAGHSIGGRVTACYAALAAASNPLFIHQARLATATIHSLGWTTLSIAAALWAIRPLRPAASIERLFLGWVVCGAAMGIALLTSGTGALLWIVLPILAVLLLCRDRIGHLMGLVAALVIGVLMAMPWAVNVHLNDPEAWRLLAVQGLPADTLGSLLSPRAWGWRMLVLMVGLLPWTLWLGGAMVQPMSHSSAGSRKKLFLGWLWFTAGLLTLVATAGGRISSIVPIVPAASVLIAQLFSQYADLAAEARFPRSWRVLRWPHAGLLVVISLAVALAGPIQERARDAGWIEQVVLGPMSLWVWLASAILLLAVVALSLRWISGEYPGRALVCWAGWMLALMTILTVPLMRAPAMRSSVRLDADTLSIIVQDKPVYWLHVPGQASTPSPELLLYADRLIPSIRMEQLEQMVGEQGQFYVLGPQLERAPIARCRSVAQLRSLGRTLWRCSRTAALATSAPAEANERMPDTTR